jgi:hypothetical protein
LTFTAEPINLAALLFREADKIEYIGGKPLLIRFYNLLCECEAA